jgi:hypothetical protein
MKNALRLVSLSFFIFPLKCWSQNWNLKVNKDGIKIYNLKNDTSKFNELKVIADLDGTVKSIVETIIAIDKQPDWVYGTKTAHIVSRISETEFHFYKEIHSPSPLNNRDLVAHLKVHEYTEKKAVIKVSAKPNLIPEKKGLVRIAFSQETWIITSLSPIKTKIEYFLKADPGGTVPPLLVNLFATKGPFESFANLKRLTRTANKLPSAVR